MKKSLAISFILILTLLSFIGISYAGRAASPVDYLAGAISGNVSYRSIIPGSPSVDALLFTNPADPPEHSVAVPFPGGPYTFGSGPDGSYYVAAQIDVNGSGGPPETGEPFAWYDRDLDGNPDLISVSGSDVGSIDVLLPASPFWSHAGEQGGANFGEAVGAAGDVNGDGYDDVLVGARLFDHGGYTDAGRAYLFYGEAGGLGDNPQVIEPPVPNAYGFFGEVATGAGDVNGDGYDDILISTPNYESDYSTPDEGAVFVWYGSASGIGSSYDWHAESNLYYGHMGLDFGAGPAGDVNGDGYDDIIAGAVRYDFNNVAHAFVWFGSATGLDPGGRSVGTPANADWSAAAPTGLSGDVNCNWFGRAVGTVGDANDDGYDDVFVTAHNHESEAGENNEGAVFVWYGAAAGLGDPGTLANADWSAEGNQAGARLGYHAAAAGDVDGDGYGDFAVGAYLYDNGADNEGLLQLYYGSAAGLESTPGWTAEGEAASLQLGLHVGTGADFNGDGYDDLLAGVHGFDAAALAPVPNAGAALIWFGSPSGPGPEGTPLNADWLATGEAAGVYFGYRFLSGKTDLNGDGLADVLVGNLHYDNPSQAADGGKTFAYYGTPDPIAGLTAVAESPVALGQATSLEATVTGGTAISYTWNFGDDEVGYGTTISHTYAAAGTYTATVTASNALHSRWAEAVIVVQETVGGLSAANDGPTTLGQQTTFTATITAGDGVTFAWDFGDGHQGNGATAAHTYAATGAYTATVVATNAVSSDSVTTTVVVEEPVTERYLYLPAIRRR